MHLNNITSQGRRKNSLPPCTQLHHLGWHPARCIYFGSFIINCVLALALNMSIRKRLIFGSSKINEQLSEVVAPSSLKNTIIVIAHTQVSFRIF